MRKETIYDVIIIGAGPAGCITAYQCGKEGLSVLVLEKNPIIGKKILSTGNGKCNLSNKNQYKEAYRGEDAEFAWRIVQNYPLSTYMHTLSEWGILTKDKNGYLYPYSEQAMTVREAMESALFSFPNLFLKTECQVKAIQKKSWDYIVKSSLGTYYGKTLVITTGGLAAPKLGSTGDGYTLAKQCGHSIIKPMPALTALKSTAPFLKKLSGVRNQARMDLFIDDVCMASERGELQWTEYGLSGVAVFQLSRYAIVALEQKKKVHIMIDMLPDLSEEELMHLLKSMCASCPYKTVAQLLQGLLAVKLCAVIAREARIEAERKADTLSRKDFVMLSKAMKHFLLKIQDYMGFDKAQVTRGGVDVRELDGQMQSRISPGLFFAGEVVDVDGSCGGYNLQWAYSSARAAEEGIERYLENYDKKR